MRYLLCGARAVCEKKTPFEKAPAAIHNSKCIESSRTKNWSERKRARARAMNEIKKAVWIVQVSVDSALYTRVLRRGGLSRNLSNRRSPASDKKKESTMPPTTRAWQSFGKLKSLSHSQARAHAGWYLKSARACKERSKEIGPREKCREGNDSLYYIYTIIEFLFFPSNEPFEHFSAAAFCLYFGPESMCAENSNFLLYTYMILFYALCPSF